jgi:hypothetical protein
MAGPGTDAAAQSRPSTSNVMDFTGFGIDDLGF